MKFSHMAWKKILAEISASDARKIVTKTRGGEPHPSFSDDALRLIAAGITHPEEKYGTFSHPDTAQERFHSIAASALGVHVKYSPAYYIALGQCLSGKL